MLTRLKVSGFKNLVDVDVRFGAFTCIAGANGVGKSNLFDAIRFLSALADKSLVEAAMSVRDESGRASELQHVFHRSGEHHQQKMRFEAEMIVPATGLDDLGQPAKATITFLRYIVELGFRQSTTRSENGLELLHEELKPIRITDASKYLLFPHNAGKWRKAILTGKRSGSPFISTDGEPGNRVIKLHQDGSSGRPLGRAAGKLPRTVLSAANAAESPTTLIARREMQSWRLLQLEPSSLREPDSFSSPATLTPNGAHLASTLHRLAHRSADDGPTDAAAVYARVSNRLAQLIRDVRTLEVDRDEKRELFTIQIEDTRGTTHAARSLSDGTLRFLALAVIEQDPQMKGVLCLEEPENGIHPERIPAMLQLLQDIATDPHDELDESEPLRQVIINTHSPAVVQQVPEDSLLIAKQIESHVNTDRISRAVFCSLPQTWRSKAGGVLASPADIAYYCVPLDAKRNSNGRDARRQKLVMERDDVEQLMLQYPRD